MSVPEDYVQCASPVCKRSVNASALTTVSVTKRLAPASVDYYHPACFDPWADLVGYGAGS